MLVEVKPGLVLEDYEFIKAIGEGSYSHVWQVRSRRFDRLFVAKISVADGDVDICWNAFDCEIQALSRLSHPNIINLYAHFRVENHFFLILEYFSNGSLEDRLRDGGPLRDRELVQTVRDVCLGLSYAWSQGVRHRDMKPGNIMFDASGRAKIVDFGISTTQPLGVEKRDVTDFKCSLVCAAPEVLQKVPYDPVKGDVWAMGVTILWMARGCAPWDYDGWNELMKKIRYGQFVVPEGMDQTVEAMARGMLMLAPKDRSFPTDRELMMMCGDVAHVTQKTRRVSDLLPCNAFGTLKIVKGLKLKPGIVANSGIADKINSNSPIVPRLRRGPGVLPNGGMKMGAVRGDNKAGVRANSHLAPLLPMKLAVMQ